MNSEEQDKHMNKKMCELMEHYDRKQMHEKLKMHDAHLHHMEAGKHSFNIKTAKQLHSEIDK